MDDGRDGAARRAGGEDGTMRIDEHAALLVIDVQRGFDEPVWGPRDNPDAEANIARLVEAWTTSGRPIVLVRHDSRTLGATLDARGPGHRFKPVLDGVRHELLVTKHVNSAFIGEPDLEAWLREQGIEQIVVCGIQTNMCVETTARMGGNLGFDVVAALDATHTFDLEGPDGRVVPAAELGRITAVNLEGGGFAHVATTAEVVEAAQAVVAATAPTAEG